MPLLKRRMFKKTSYISLGRKTSEEAENPEVLKEESVPETPSIPDGLFIKCKRCGSAIYKADWEEAYGICPHCHHYGRLGARDRIHMIADARSFEEWNEVMPVENPLDFPRYEDKIARTKEKTGLDEGVVTGLCEIYAEKAVLAVMDASFMMGSMGHVVGEKITAAVEEATRRKLPMIIFCCSGGARMQEGMISLMQMAKTSAALKRHSEAGLPYFSILTDPTTGGVTASFAMLGDVIIAEPKTLIGFAGQRVIEQTIGEKLPKGFQRAEFALEHGLIDMIVKREDMKKVLYQLILGF